MTEDQKSANPTLDDLLSFIKSTVDERFLASRQPTDGACLAQAIRTKWPDFDYSLVGLRRLGDLVQAGEERGLVCRDRTVTHLLLLPHGPVPGSPVRQSKAVIGKLRYVRPDIWRAFITSSPGETCWYDAEDQTVVAVTSAQREAEMNQDPMRYKLIEPFALSDQRTMMTAFLESRSGLNASEAPVHEERCYISFPNWLRRQSATLLSEWRQFRTAEAIKYIRSWAERNKVPPESLFSSLRPTRAVGQQDSKMSSSDSSQLRSAILAAIDDMTMDELEQLRIPLRHILRHFRPI